ncbi:MAG TPA: hypothetical protein VFD63_05830, partial [Pyrinomonadaceae bacterium]|nr:hypothetical protein [Pyrinomonadaceae bacterium]
MGTEKISTPYFSINGHGISHRFLRVSLRSSASLCDLLTLSESEHRRTIQSIAERRRGARRDAENYSKLRLLGPYIKLTR